MRDDDDDDNDDDDDPPSTMIATKMMDADAKKLHFRPSGHSVILENIPISQIKIFGWPHQNVNR